MTTTILIGDVFERLADLPADSIDCCVTSPPYWGLRDYAWPDRSGSSQRSPSISTSWSASIGQRAARITMMQRAAGFLKQAALAEAMGIGVRSLQSKLDVTRGLTDADMLAGAAALEQRAAEITALAAQMREAAR